jgi:hypothetical protein
VGGAYPFLSLSDILTAIIDDDLDSEAKTHKPGIELQSCQHACEHLRAIYRNLNVFFDPSTYGTQLAPTPWAQGLRFPWATL